MGMPVVFTLISSIMLPVRLGRDGLIPKILCVGSNAWLIFDDHDAGSGMFDKER